MSSGVTDWRTVLSDYLDREERSEREANAEQVTASTRWREFMDRSVLPAFRALREELQRHGRRVEIISSEWRADLIAHHHGRMEFHAAVKLDEGTALLVLFEEHNGRPVPVEASFAVGMSRPQDVTEEEVLLALVGPYTHGGRHAGEPPV